MTRFPIGWIVPKETLKKLFPDATCNIRVNAPATAKAIILNCPESDIILSRFRLEPIGSDPVVVWASKVMLRER